MSNNSDDASVDDWRLTNEISQKQYKAVLDAVRLQAAERGERLSHKDAQDAASRMYQQLKITPERILDHLQQDRSSNPAKQRLIDALAEVLERSKAERIAAAISDLVEGGSQQQQALSVPQKKPRSYPDASQVLDVKQLAELLGVSPRMVWKLRKEDPSFPKPMQLGTLVRWRLADYEAWIKKQQP